MSNTLQSLRENRNALAKQANHMLDQQGDRIWDKDAQVKYDDIIDKIENCGKQIVAWEKRIDDDVETNFRDIENFRHGANDSPENEGSRAFNIFMRKGTQHISRDEAILIQNTMSTTTPSEGGYTVPTEIAAQLIEAVKGFGSMRKVAEQQSTEKGNAINWPTSDGTAEVGEWLAENVSATDQDIAFGTRPVNVFRASSKIIAVPIELLQDSSINIEALVFRRMGSRIGRLANNGYTTGTGTGQPAGIMASTTAGKIGATGQTLTITYDDLVDLVESIDYGYVESGASMMFMFNQAMRSVIRKLKDTQNRPIWTPNYDMGISVGQGDQLLNYPVQINNSMAVPAANARTIAFGDLSQYLIRDALEVSIWRFDDSVYVSKGQIGFLAFMRTGGNLLDVQAVKHYAHSAT